jgi:hypothetical protein
MSVCLLSSLHVLGVLTSVHVLTSFLPVYYCGAYLSVWLCPAYMSVSLLCVCSVYNVLSACPSVSKSCLPIVCMLSGLLVRLYDVLPSFAFVGGYAYIVWL